MPSISIIKVVLCSLLIIISGCMPALSSESLPESDHPYANNFEKTWTVSEPGAAQIRLHFENLDLSSFDNLYILDKYDDELKRYSYSMDSKDLWTEWYAGDTLKVKLVTDDSYTSYGFKIDDVDTRSSISQSNDSLPESDHPYANNFENTWTISKPGADQIRLHFENLDLSSFDNLYILDKYDDELKRYSYSMDSKDLWTEWYAGDKLKVKLVTDDSYTSYGFKIDKVDTRLDGANNSSESLGNSKSTVPETQYDGTETDVNKVLTTTELTSSANSSPLGQSVTLVAKVDTPSKENEEPIGTVTFVDGTTPIGTADVSSGQATLNTSLLSVGSHSITAVYNGDNNFKSSTSSPVTLMIKEQHSSEEQPITEQLPNSEEQHSAKKSSTVKNIVVFLSENPLVSSIIASLFVALILERKKKAEEEMKKAEEEMKKIS